MTKLRSTMLQSSNNHIGNCLGEFVHGQDAVARRFVCGSSGR